MNKTLSNSAKFLCFALQLYTKFVKKSVLGGIGLVIVIAAVIASMAGALYTYTQYQTNFIEVVAGDGAKPGAGEFTAMARSDEGEMPGLAAVNSTVVTATVEEINLEANTFKLKGPNGEINEFVARDPENLRKAAVGDLVIITYTEAVAIAVQKTEAE